MNFLNFIVIHFYIWGILSLVYSPIQTLLEKYYKDFTQGSILNQDHEPQPERRHERGAD